MQNRPFQSPGLISYAILLTFTSVACNGPLSLGGKKAPHDRYTKGLEDAGLGQTALGRKWIESAAYSLSAPVTVELPYRETGFFASDKPNATGLSFNAKKGQRVNVTLQTTPVNSSGIFMELWGQSPLKRLAYIDSLNRSISEEIETDGVYLVRIQPELLQPVGYTIVINAGPSLAFPVRKQDNPRALSFWGANRDAGVRSHEGVDIFAKKGTDAIAIANGNITRVNENRLGGKVVFLRPDGKDYSLYYAHLDSQLVSAGQRVQTGDVVGHIGNTGNARTTPAHLHFGIYTSGGATDPWPFINNNVQEAARVTADTSLLALMARTSGKQQLVTSKGVKLADLPDGHALTILAAVTDRFRIRLPDGREGFIRGTTISRKPLKKELLRIAQPLLASPDTSGAVIREIPAGTEVSVMSVSSGFSQVEFAGQKGWITR